MSTVTVKAKVKKQLFYSEDTRFGVYSFSLIESDEDVRVDKQWDTFLVKGKCNKLQDNVEYDFKMITVDDKKYGQTYQFEEFVMPKLTSKEGQESFLRQIVTERQANILVAAYPDVNIVDYIEEDKIDVNKLKGIKQHTYNTIKDKVKKFKFIENALVELKDLEISFDALNRLITHFGSEEQLISAVKENIYSLTEVSLFGFKKVDEYAMNRGDSPIGENRIRACIEYVVDEEANQKGHTWSGVDYILETTRELLSIEGTYIREYMDKINEKDKKFLISGDRFTLKKFHKWEKEVVENLDRLLEKFNGNERFKSLSDVESKLGIELTDEQRRGVEITQKKGVAIINGVAGSGKTTIMKSVVESFPLDRSYIAVALSGKAVQVLISKGLQAMTLHRLLMNDSAPDYDTIIVDESSMVNLPLFHALLTNMLDGQQIILVGDNGQLPPIGVGSVFDDLLSSERYPRQELTKIHRQAAESGIITLANKVRDGQHITTSYQSGKMIEGKNGDAIFYFMEKDDILPNVLKIVKNYFGKFGESFFDNFQIVTPVKVKGQSSVKQINMNVQQIVNACEGKGVKKNDITFYEGDRIIHNGNIMYNQVKDIEEYESLQKYGLSGVDYQIYNGTTGRIQSIDYDNEILFIEYEGTEGLIVHPFKEIKNIDLSYAITIHRSQGMGIKNVLMLLDYSAYNMLSKQLVYTGMTRASEKLVVLCINSALRKSVETDLGSTRRTFMKDFLNEL